MRGSQRPNRSGIFWPPLLWPSTLCLSRSLGLLNRKPRAHSARWWLSLPHLISNFSGLQLIRALRAPSAWRGFFYHILSATYLQTVPNCLTSVLTELYNSSTLTQSPTRSLEWHVWSSSSGNNCHAVQRSLSSGVSVYECIMGFFTLSSCMCIYMCVHVVFVWIYLFDFVRSFWLMTYQPSRVI